MADPYANQYGPPTTGHQPQYPPSPFGPQQHQQGYDQSYFASQTPMHQQPMATDQTVALQDSHHVAGTKKPDEYNDPQAVSLSDYKQHEREEHMYNNNSHYYQDAGGYGGGGGAGYSDYNNNYNQYAGGGQNNYGPSHAPYYDDPTDVPMVQQNASSRPRPTGGPTLAPEDEAAAYKPKQYKRHEDGGGCNCCCYNPECTCYNCFCWLLNVAFLIAGIALIVSASVIQGKCEDQCGEIPEQLSDAAETCGTICGKVVHDALFYSGIGITALAGLAVVWRLVMCMCAAGSRR
ncbi:hypothetical protein BDA99DRAFT_602627 [Phascolomyces articulosus]|uniref:Uncharacterized protein n=1 Tax=Phascolomyces articulosus TaxID=60185 RepID=A0AAD5KIT0_9FUNG|nr:hypothetical protein BDA99DRAFT_602627 [Phascolomyces articulosus]